MLSFAMLRGRHAEALTLCRQAIGSGADFDQVSCRPTSCVCTTRRRRQPKPWVTSARRCGSRKKRLRSTKLWSAKAHAPNVWRLQIEYEVQHAEWQRDRALSEQRSAEEERRRLADLNQALAAINTDKKPLPGGGQS